MKTLNCGDYLVTLTQEAYISDCGLHYFASGEYQEEEEIFSVLVRWDVKENYDGTDESEACDWEDFYVEELGIK